jgi:hypothetical protein
MCNNDDVRTRGNARVTPSGDSSSFPRGVTTSVVLAVADAAGIDPIDLPPIYDIVDPDALDGLFGAAGGRRLDGEVSFRYYGYLVTVRSDGGLTVEPTDVE